MPNRSLVGIALTTLLLVGGVSNRARAQTVSPPLVTGRPSSPFILAADPNNHHSHSASRSTGSDTAAKSHRRATIVGSIVGGVAGGLAAAGYILNATAYDCITIGPPCPYDPHTTRRIVTISAGAAGGAILGGWVGHRLGAWRS